MLNRRNTTVLPGALAILLAGMLLHSMLEERVVRAQPVSSDLYIEPGTTIIRPLDGNGQVQGKVVINLHSGDIWGFPTNTSAPYPVDPASDRPPVSKPVYLGRYDFSAMKRP